MTVAKAEALEKRLAKLEGSGIARLHTVPCPRAPLGYRPGELLPLPDGRTVAATDALVAKLEAAGVTVIRPAPPVARPRPAAADAAGEPVNMAAGRPAPAGGEGGPRGGRPRLVHRSRSFAEEHQRQQLRDFFGVRVP